MAIVVHCLCATRVRELRLDTLDDVAQCIHPFDIKKEEERVDDQHGIDTHQENKRLI
jgi:hypothetical protein